MKINSKTVFEGLKEGGLSVSGTPQYSRFIVLSRYAKWLEYLTGEKRREEWDETVQRFITHMQNRFPQAKEEIADLSPMIYNLHAMPSMRAMATSGPALLRDEVPLYNCAFLGIQSIEDIDETMYILLCGTGVGFSVERRFTDKLPSFYGAPAEMGFLLRGEDSTYVEGAPIHVIEDSKEGWATAFRLLLTSCYDKKSINFDFNSIRPEGSVLKTFGGRASGPSPLYNLFTFVHTVFWNAYNRATEAREFPDAEVRLSSTELADIVCMVAQTVVVGGVRRSALLCLSDADDHEMALFKTGEWWKDNSHRALANISAAYDVKPTLSEHMKEWSNLYDSFSGERGIFSRFGAKAKLARDGRRDLDHDFGVNPCGEQILRPNQFCNLSEAVVRPYDSIDDIKRKIYAATAFGTMQSAMCEFRYLRPIWKENTEGERLLGVSMTGVYEHPILGDISNPELPSILKELRAFAQEVNREWADLIGIKPSVGVTTMKPSGTLSQLANTSPGVNCRPVDSPHYIRSVRADRKDPLARLMRDLGFPHKLISDGSGEQWLFSFPMINPHPVSTSAIHDYTLWTLYNDNWSDHAVSTTINYRDEDFMALGQKVYNDFDKITGVAFLPFSGHIYENAPYTPCTEEEYEALVEQMPEDEICAVLLSEYEDADNTAASQTFACVGGACEVIDLV